MAEAPPPTGSAAPSHDFERDLKDVREARGVALESLQTETRLPADILHRFEAGELLGDPRYNNVYVRALLRAYASAVGLPAHDVLEAYDAHVAGTYRRELRRHLGEDVGAAAAAPPPADAPEAVAPPPVQPAPPPADEAAPPAPEAKAPEPPPAPARPGTPAPAAPAAGLAPAVAALSGTPPAPPPPPADVTGRPNEHFAKSRVQSEAEARAPAQPIDRSWGLVIGGAVAALALIAAVLFFLFRDTSPSLEADEDALAVADTAEAAPPPADSALAAGAAPDAAPMPADAPRLQMPITVTVVAAGGPLQNFRVEAQPDMRRPYWMEQGTEQTFTSSQAVVVWGTEAGGSYAIPAEARLRMQGLEWSPRTVQRIDATRGQAILDSLYRAGGRAR